MTAPNPRHGRFSKWLQEQLDRRSILPAHFADNAGLGRSVVTRWINEGYVPNIATARAAANELGVPLLKILIESEQLSDSEAAAYSRVRSLQEVPDAELAAEVTRRLTQPRPRRRR